jgi:hypothetical protein
MDRHDFLDFGTAINKADDPIQMEIITERLLALPEDAERAYLQHAADCKRRMKRTLCSEETTAAVLPLAKLWCSMDERARRNLQDVLAGTMEIHRLTHQVKSSSKFYDWLKVFAGSDNPVSVVKAFLRVQEATEQFLWDAEGKQRPPSKWSTLQSIRTLWRD